MQYFLFLAHIGPIQTFIASARRTRDLYYGSNLLSELSKLVASILEQRYGIESLIFPAPKTRDELEMGSNLNVSNKILVRIPIDADPKTVGTNIREEIHTYLKRRWTQTRKDIEGELEALETKQGRTFYSEKAHITERSWQIGEQQIEDMVEYFWAALPCTESNYEARRLELERLMAARKNTRLFKSVSWGGAEAKSSIDGQLESILPEELYSNKTIYRKGLRSPEHEAMIQRQASILYDVFGAGPGERLSGVDLLKRRGTFEKMKPNGEVVPNAPVRFPSTSHIAAQSYLTCLNKLNDGEQEQLKRIWQSYIQQTKKLGITEEQALEFTEERHKVLGNYDGGMLFAERLIQDTVHTTQLEEAQQKLDAFLKQANSYFERPISLLPYYAILVADGDGMGEAIDYQAKLPEGREKHRRLSKTLAGFADKAKGIIKKHQGAAIYTGGDDVVAFLPIHTTLACTRELADTFSETMRPFKNEKEEKGPTLSAGIAIVHHLEMLQEALAIARRAEKLAKNVEGKNAAAIIVAKRGGEQYSVAGQWSNLDDYIEGLVSCCVSGDIPNGIAYAIRDTVQRFQALDAEKSTTTVEMTNVIRADIQRILLRRLTNPDKKVSRANKGEQQETTLYEYLLARIDVHPEKRTKGAGQRQTSITILEQEKQMVSELTVKALKNSKGNIDFQEFINELLVAQVLAETKRLIEIPVRSK